MITKSKDMETRVVQHVAELMCVAARTAPKGRGVDNLVTMVVQAGAKDRLVEEMRRISKTTGVQFFERDANSVEQSLVVVLMGQKITPMGVAPCGYCGYNDCQECSKHKGLCAISIGDLGIALGSAVSIAADHRVDNRIMFSAGKAALNLNYFEEEVSIAYAIPLSVSGKNPFFDRK